MLIGEALMAAIMSMGHMDLWGPDMRARGRRLYDELLSSAEATSDPAFLTIAHMGLTQCSLLDGELEEARRHANLYVSLA